MTTTMTTMSSMTSVQSSLRVKIIVLGSVGAGKTSLLRRYVHDTFEPTSRSDLDDENDANKNSCRTSTLGADYYVKRVKNPLFGDSVERDGNSNHRDVSTAAAAESGDSQTSPESSAAKMKLPPMPSPLAPSLPASLRSQPHVLLQLWDTAGRERAPPAKSSRWGPHSRPPTRHANRSDLRYGTHSSYSDYQPRQPRQRLDHDCRRKNDHLPNDSPLGDALFRHIDACLLVYDATRTVSFLQLMQWHSELLRRVRSLQEEDLDEEEFEDRLEWDSGGGWDDDLDNDSDDPLENEHAKQQRTIACPRSYVTPHVNQTNTRDNNALMDSTMEQNYKHGSKQNTKPSKFTGPRRRRRKHIPVIVVATKIDLLKHNDTTRRVPQRSVMGFQDYRGKNFTYEYTVESDSYVPDDPNDHHRSNRLPKLTYSLNENLWEDRHYLRSLQIAEEKLLANRPMILLWCCRNSIPHVEVSSRDGTGVQQAMERLIRMSVVEMGEREKEKEALEKERMRWRNRKKMRTRKNTKVDNGIVPDNDNQHQPIVYGVHPNDNNRHESASIALTQYYHRPAYEQKLDLFARYSPKEDKGCCRCILPFIDDCRR